MAVPKNQPEYQSLAIALGCSLPLFDLVHFNLHSHRFSGHELSGVVSAGRTIEVRLSLFGGVKLL